MTNGEEAVEQDYGEPLCIGKVASRMTALRTDFALRADGEVLSDERGLGTKQQEEKAQQVRAWLRGSRTIALGLEPPD
jgi:hypothetical protein